MLSSENDFHIKIFALTKHIEHIRFSWFQFQFTMEKFSPYLVGFHFVRKTLNCHPSSPVWPDLGELEQTLNFLMVGVFCSGNIYVEVPPKASKKQTVLRSVVNKCSIARMWFPKYVLLPTITYKRWTSKSVKQNIELFF